MSIWMHSQVADGPTPYALTSTDISRVTLCVYCSNHMTSFDDLYVCDRCGWWMIEHFGVRHSPDGDASLCEITTSRAWGALKNLDVTEINVATDELCSYLLAHFGDRGRVHPKKFEDIVGSVFRNLGYTVRVTGCSNDGGIDLVVMESGNKEIAIQVKRHKGKIEAEHIRAFAGALLRKGMAVGIYVTTSAFTKGAKKTTTEYAALDTMKIELWDAEVFYEKLGIANQIKLTSALVEEYRVIASHAPMRTVDESLKVLY